MKNSVALATVIGVMAVIGAGGVAIGSRLESPADVASLTAPPEASPVTARVVRQTLTSDLVARGTIRFADPVSLVLAGPVGSRSSTPPAQVVTAIAERGSTLHDGAVALTVAGRPVFVVTGAVPMYRTITPGDSGADVRQLEDALVRFGFDPGPVDGLADGALQLAVARWYQSNGFEPQALTEEDEQQQRTREAAVSTAKRDLLTAQDSLARSQRPPTRAEFSKADIAVATAVNGVAAAQRQAANAVLAAQADVAAKDRGLAEARGQLSSATAELDLANKQRAAAIALDPPDPTAVTAADVAIRTANERIATSTRAITQAQSDLDAANRTLLQAPAVGDEAVRLAELSVQSAVADRAALDEVRDTALASAQVAAAQEALDNARDSLSRFNASHGITVPAGEIVFVPTAPIRIDDVKLKVGNTVGGVVMTLSGTQLAVDTSVAVADRAVVEQGATVTIDITDFSITTTGVIQTIDAKPGTRGLDAQRVYVGVALDDATLASDLNGAAVRATIPIASTADDVLTVPVSAIFTRANGSSSVVVLRNGARIEVEVTTGLAAGGFAEITTSEPALLDGDRVVVESAVATPDTASNTASDTAETTP